MKNFTTIREVLDKYDGRVVRYFFVSNHYRTPLNFSYEILDQSKNSLDRLNEFVRKLRNSKEKDDLNIINKTKEKIVKALDDDFDTPKAFSYIFDFMRNVNKKGGGKKSYEFIVEINNILDVLDLKEENIPKEILELAKERDRLRKEKKWDEADKVRGKLKKKGYIIEDNERGFKIKKLT